MATLRIQKIIADSGFCSRRKAEEYISQRRVTCNGNLVALGAKADPAKDQIAIDGQRISSTAKRELYYIMLYKPRGYITTMLDDRGRRCVAELVQDVPERVYPVGRLDVNSEGLLLFTNDGTFANRIMHPSHHISKTYRVTIRPDITDEQAAQLAGGVYLDGRKTAPAVVRILSKQENRVVLELVIREGRNRQIRRMMESVGLEVARLKRTSVGPVKLGMLQPGKWRALTSEEIKSLQNAMK